MNPIRFLIVALLSIAMLGVVRAAEPDKVYWYEIVIQSGQSVERFIGSSTVTPDELTLALKDEITIELENLRALENRGDGPRWWSIREGEMLRLRTSRVLYFYVLQKDPRISPEPGGAASGDRNR